ncbi:glycosyltransferase [Soonwooa sp.]|uniref:glycosyltransferase n=1 Tax=Soonwooa sp. TaxID=1938592 RepID=UPI0026276CC4|nr:glycosyltransferase [Soonwooa sp.]
MILIDAIFINCGGGKILLDYLYQVLQESGLNVTMLIDERIKDEYILKQDKNISLFFLKKFSERNTFLKTNKNAFSKVLCFGNTPPNVKMKATVYTYFHQAIYFNIPKEFSLLEKVKFNIKIYVLKKYNKNTDFWMVQSDFIRKGLENKFKIENTRILEIPFYPPLSIQDLYVQREKNTFIFVSNATPNKNHIRLINSFCKFYDKFGIGRLTLTVSDSFPEVKGIIEDRQKQGYPIENLGFITRHDLCLYYRKSEYLIFPSLAESFGLGIVEAIENGCKVIGADLGYMYEACEPSLVFNPTEEQSIYDSFCIATSQNLPESKQNIYNKVDELIKLLKD